MLLGTDICAAAHAGLIILFYIFTSVLGTQAQYEGKNQVLPTSSCWSVSRVV